MCGIAGIVVRDGRPESALRSIVSRMAAALTHRGPDSEGTWVDPDAGVALGHRRLAVVDVSAAGHQPMVGEGGRFVLSYNGEIYNHVALRAELSAAGHAFRGHSDTEVMLAAFEAFGVEAAVRRFEGMFAFSLWDVGARTLWLGRDRIGEKPLYFTERGAMFAFASELKALRTVEGLDVSVDRAALGAYLESLYVPGPRTIYQDVSKLEPGSLLAVGADGARRAPQRYWRLGDAGSGPSERGGGEAALGALLDEVVDQEVVADVPVGAFLSGGIDSSLVVASMRRRAHGAVRTFSIGFAESDFDESVPARRVAEHLETDHTALQVTAAEALAVIPGLADVFDEPFADSSQIPTLLVSRLARGQVTVSLTGDGADEIFGGYNRYVWGERLWRRMAWLPTPLRGALAGAVEATPAAVWRVVGAGLRRAGITDALARHPVDKVHKAARLLRAREADAFGDAMRLGWPDARALLAAPGVERDAPAASAPAGLDFARSMMWRDVHGALPDDMLVKVDRAAMAASLETRSPFLHHRIVEHAFHLPRERLIAGGLGKVALRRLLARHLPPALLDRPKTGFEVPIADWLRGPLRSWADTLLDPARLEADGYLRAAPVRSLWSAHLAGRGNWHHPLWAVLMFQAWRERWL